MTAVPLLVQEAVTSPSTQQVLEQIGRQYALHVDVLDTLVKLTSYMLLGYVGPEEFLQEMRAARVADQQARQIIGDINQKIFMPLRLKMMQATVAPASPKPVIPQPRPVQTSVPMPKYAPPVAQRPMIAAAPANDEKLLEDHEEPHIDIKKEVPANLPGVIHIEPQKPVAPIPERPYSIDPYREPIDRK